MITLNLIPETIREENRLKHVYKLNFRLALILTYFILIISTILIIGRFVLNKISDEAVSQTNLLSKNSNSYNQKIKEINSEISAVGDALVSRHHWDKLLIDIYNLIPSNIKITNLKIDQQNKSIAMTVIAVNRDDLLKFKESINKSGYISEIDLPISAILQKDNIVYSFTSKLDFVNHENMTLEDHAIN